MAITPDRHPRLLINNIIGGLGNQMFQYACGYHQCRISGLEHKLCGDAFDLFHVHNGLELHRIFGIETMTATRLEMQHCIGWRSASARVRHALSKPCLHWLAGASFITEQDASTLCETIHRVGQDNSVYLHGYWQSQDYFAGSSDAVRSIFRFPTLESEDDLALEHSIRTVNSVSVHVRRGDYVSSKRAANTHGTCDINYYLNALDLIRSRTGSPLTIYLFSDDPAWVREVLLPHIKEAAHIISHNTGQRSYRDMHLMSLCKHNIIANSTFSWWAAWLNANPKKVIASPKNWFANGHLPPHLIPDSWILV